MGDPHAACWPRHPRFKRSTTEFEANTTPAGILSLGEGTPDLQLGTCIHGCGTTLGREIKPRGEP